VISAKGDGCAALLVTWLIVVVGGGGGCCHPGDGFQGYTSDGCGVGRDGRDAIYNRSW
jgi:hypothetical protein